MKELKLYRESNGQYSTSEAQQDDVGGVYVQKEHLTDLQKQNDELRAKVAKYESVLCQTCQGAGTVLAGVDDGRDCPTCVQSLSDIKAEGVIGAIEKCNANAEEEDNGERLIYVSDLVDYANQLKEGRV